MKGASLDEANALAWQEGKQRLELAIETRRSFAFESTLGGNTIPGLLREAANAGLKVIVWFVGLSTPEQHIARVRARVASGGHDIPEEMIRQRWDSSRRNVIALMPFLADLWVFDNSYEGDSSAGTIPPPRELLYLERGAIVSPDADALAATPDWAKPIVRERSSFSARRSDDQSASKLHGCRHALTSLPRGDAPRRVSH